MMRSFVVVALVAAVVLPFGTAAFSWQNCGSSEDPLELQSLSLGPNPLVLGQNITLSFTATLTGANISAGSKASVTIWKKEGVWIEIPCLDNVGSCAYPDLCSMFKQQSCGPIAEKYNLPCHCPFSQGTYSIPTTVSIPTKNPGLSWLTDGELSAQGVVTNQDGTRIGCYLVYVSISEGQMKIGQTTEPLKDHPALAHKHF